MLQYCNDPQIGRFTTIDRLVENYKRWSSYAYAIDNPVRYEDYNGDGPKDRIKAARLLIASGANYDNTINNVGERYRTGYSKEAMKSFDCAEFVSRVMAADGITPSVENRVRGSFLSLVNDKSKFKHSMSAHEGDIALWYGWTVKYVKDDQGNDTDEKIFAFHTGIVTAVDENGKYKLAAARYKDAPGGDLLENPNFTTSNKYRGDIDFLGFYSPLQETPDGKDISITRDTNLNRTDDQNQENKKNNNMTWGQAMRFVASWLIQNPSIIFK